MQPKDSTVSPSHSFFLFFVFCFFLLTRFSAYSFLDPHKEHGFLAVYIVGIALAACLAFTLTRLLCVLRVRLVTPRRMDSTHEKDSPPEAIDDWQEIERPDTPVAV
jgi:hypothetical protein